MSSAENFTQSAKHDVELIQKMILLPLCEETQLLPTELSP